MGPVGTGDWGLGLGLDNKSSKTLAGYVPNIYAIPIEAIESTWGVICKEIKISCDSKVGLEVIAIMYVNINGFDLKLNTCNFLSSYK